MENVAVRRDMTLYGNRFYARTWLQVPYRERIYMCVSLSPGLPPGENPVPIE